MSEVADDLAEIASLVRELRKRKGITLQALADGIRRSVGFVSQVERGLSRPAVDDLVAISQVLGVPATYFFCSPKIQASPWVTRPGRASDPGLRSWRQRQPGIAASRRRLLHARNLP